MRKRLRVDSWSINYVIFWSGEVQLCFQEWCYLNCWRLEMMCYVGCVQYANLDEKGQPYRTEPCLLLPSSKSSDRYL